MRCRGGSGVHEASLLACLKVSDHLLEQLKDPASGVSLPTGGVWTLPGEVLLGAGWVVVIYAVDGDGDDHLVEAVVGRYA